MSDGSLSQDEIDALLQGTDTIEMDAAAGGAAETGLSDEQRDAFQNLLKTLVESQSSNLSMLTGKTVRIDAPTTEIVTQDQLPADLPDELVEVKIDFTEGIVGEHLYLLPIETATRIASLMLGQEGIELDEMALSTIGEAISNITGPTTTELGNRITETIQTETPRNRRTTKEEIDLPQEESFIKVDYPLTIEGDMPSRLIEIFPLSMVMEVASLLSGGLEAAAEVGSPAEASQPQVSDMDNLFRSPEPGESSGMQQTFGQPLGGATPAPQTPPPNVQPVQFANLQPSNIPSEQGNIGLLMDVFMEMTVELGRTKKLIKEILTIGEGTIIELDKLAGEPVDILVNHKLIAKGEVVVIDENFGVRVTEIVSPMERMTDLT
jgi:flagellar motor switch protein FliN/FliY